MIDRDHQEALLDEGLEESFPANDPVSVVFTPAREGRFDAAPALPSNRTPWAPRAVFVLAAALAALAYGWHRAATRRRAGQTT